MEYCYHVGENDCVLGRVKRRDAALKNLPDLPYLRTAHE